MKEGSWCPRERHHCCSISGVSLLSLTFLPKWKSIILEICSNTLPLIILEYVNKQQQKKKTRQSPREVKFMMVGRLLRGRFDSFWNIQDGNLICSNGRIVAMPLGLTWALPTASHSKLLPWEDARSLEHQRWVWNRRHLVSAPSLTT